MKKNLLLIFSILFFYGLKAQVSFIVLQPEAIQGGYNFTYNSPPFWGVPDLSDPANSVTGSVVLAVDGSASDSLGCQDFITDVAGKIALVYRGTCFHDVKALNAQQAGAIGIILINNAPGQMPQVSGENPGDVTIPLTMISDEAGAAMRAQLEAGENVEVFIGNSTGYFENDFGLSSKTMLIPSSSLLPSSLAQDSNEFRINLGAWVYNYGTNIQTTSLRATILFGSDPLFSTTSAAADLSQGDSTYFSLPSFTQIAYPEGVYNVVYEALGATDQFAYNNTISHKISINNDKFGLVKVNPNGVPETTGAFQAPNSTQSTIFESCIVFRDENASRLAAKGLSFYATTDFGSSIVGEFVEVKAYAWNDVFTGNSDPAFDVMELEEIAYTVYDYEENLQSVTIPVDFEEPFIMEDNQRYLFCIVSYGQEKYLGFDSNIHYEQNIAQTDQPVMALFINEEYTTGLNPPAYPSIILNTIPASEVGLNETNKSKIISYPNPASHLISIPINNIGSAEQLIITDATGRIVSEQKIEKEYTGNTLKVNVENINNGIYYFNIIFNHLSKSTFRVVINK
jgi:PA domain/Secretion system C-terminal sorting domain